MRIDKLARGLAGTLGKTVARAYVVGHPDGRSFVYLVFSDDTYYELYGEYIEGARDICPGASADLPLMLRRTAQHADIREIALPGASVDSSASHVP